MTAWMTARAASAETMIVRRGRRSAQTPPIRTNSVCGRMPAISTMPRSVGEPPRSSTAKASAIGKMPSPSTETAWPQKKSENSRSRSTASSPSLRTGRD